jgi:hypothetical protein
VGHRWPTQHAEQNEGVEHHDHALEKCQAMASAWDANFTAYPTSVLNENENQFIYTELHRRNLLDHAILGLAQEKSKLCLKIITV